MIYINKFISYNISFISVCHGVDLESLAVNMSLDLSLTTYILRASLHEPGLVTYPGQFGVEF